MITRSYKRDLEELTRRTIAGEVEWQFLEPAGFVLSSAGGDIYLAPTLTGLQLGVQQRHQALIIPTMYGDALHPEELRLLLRLYQAVLEKLEEGLHAYLARARAVEIAVLCSS